MTFWKGRRWWWQTSNMKGKTACPRLPIHGTHKLFSSCRVLWLCAAFRRCFKLSSKMSPLECLRVPDVDVIFENSLDVVLAGCHGDQSVKLLNAVVVRREFCCMRNKVGGRWRLLRAYCVTAFTVASYYLTYTMLIGEFWAFSFKDREKK